VKSEKAEFCSQIVINGNGEEIRRFIIIKYKIFKNTDTHSTECNSLHEREQQTP
jgi:hypothetical protein